MDELFGAPQIQHEPLAARMRPRTLDEYIGQDHIVGKGRLLRRAIAADQLTSVIFYGPPGSGKTTLARVIANHTKSNFITLNAVLTGVADIRKAIAEAEEQRKLYSKKTILFVDEVHRWNKSQQDALLPWVENGTIILIGATTENPFFEVNKALVSRSRVFQLKPLTKADLLNAANQALSDTERGYGHYKVQFEEGALEHLVETANGDARSLLNALELAVETTPAEWEPNATVPKPAWGSTIYISRECAEESIQKKVVLYDRDGDYHYDIISAFIKSLRGRDPDAACYWLARMVKAGEDPDFIFRRMLISACEDTGLADPYAIAVVQSCAASFDRVGMPEGRYFLAHAALYLSTAPKSNSSMAFFDALASVEKEDADVPNHLRDASRDAEGFGHGAGYLYPHAYRDHWVAQQYLPDALMGKVFYTPSKQGYENKIREEVLSRRELQIASLLTDENSAKDLQVNPAESWWQKSGHLHGLKKTEENLTFSPPDGKRSSALDNAEKSWRRRLDSNRAQTLTLIRDTMIQAAELRRHHRTLVFNADDALLLFHIMRLTPEGLTCGTCRTQGGIDILSQYASTLGDLDKPCLSLASNPKDYALAAKSFGDNIFDRIFLRDIFSSAKDIYEFAQQIKTMFFGKEKSGRDIAFGEASTPGNKDEEPLLSKDARIIISQRIPSCGQHISSLILGVINDSEKRKVCAGEYTDEFIEGIKPVLKEMESAEEKFFSNSSNPLFAWSAEDIKDSLQKEGMEVTLRVQTLEEMRTVSQKEIERWFDTENSEYGSFLLAELGEESVRQVAKLLESISKKTAFAWHITNAFIVCEMPAQA
ncbi:MAG: AAA family ATPase [Treponema sp.]|nr:AAA family ATPase [Treponema sp.]